MVRREISLARQAMVPMEGKAVLAYWDERGDQLMVYTSTQVPHMIRVGLAQCLGIDQGQVRVISPDVGGGFGYKCVLQPEELCVAWLALQIPAAVPLRRGPARAPRRRRQLAPASLSADRLCRRSAGGCWRWMPRSRSTAAPIRTGRSRSALEPGQATGNLPGPYDFRGYRCRTHCVATNKPGFLPYRGVARTGVCFAMELMMDAIAREVGREPWEVRLREPRAGLGDAVRQRRPQALRQRRLSAEPEAACARSSTSTAWRERQRRGEPDGRLIGVGFATYCEQSAHGTSVFSAWGLPIVPGYDQATVRVTPDGGLEVRVGVHSHGQGMETTLAQIAHEVLGIDVAEIRVVHGDTGATPFSTGTYASRCIVMAGGAVANACKALLPRFVAIGAHLMQCAVSTARYENGASSGRNGSVPLRDVAQAWYLRPERLPPDVDLGGLEATVGYRPKGDTGAFSYASHAAVVAVDTEIGSVEILDYVIVEDCGTLVNPMVVDGQTLGGVAQGIGTALYEESPYDANGQPLASTFADYLLPGADRDPRHPHLSHGDAVAVHRVRHQGHGRRRRHRAAGRDLQCGQRRAAAARRRARRDAADAAPAARGDRTRADRRSRRAEEPP